MVAEARLTKIKALGGATMLITNSTLITFGKENAGNLEASASMHVALDAQTGVLPRARGDVDRVKPICQKLLWWRCDEVRKLDLHSQIRDSGNVLLNDGLRQPEGGSDGQHPSRPVFGFVDGHFDTVQGQEVGGG